MLHILFFIILITNIKSEDETALASDKGCEEGTFKCLFKSFVKFKNDVKYYFLNTTVIIERRRQRIKKALLQFLEEAFGSDSDDDNTFITFSANNVPSSKLNEDVQKSMNASVSKTFVEKIIGVDGYKSESHTVVTSDGYFLTIQRVLPTLEQTNNRLVILFHGLLGSSEDWLFLGKDRALPYLLADAGFDVWLPNARGNRYSIRHTNRTIHSKEFWDFSWHEIGLYDLPAIIKYIREVTEDQLEMNFVGHSMGATALLVLLSIEPQQNQVFKSAVLLGPLAFMYHVKGPFKSLTEFCKKNDFNSQNLCDEFTPIGPFPRQVIENFCKGNERSCSNPLLLLANGGREILEMNLMEFILNRVPAGGSTKTITHYGQLVNSGLFQMYDYGQNNSLKYGNHSVPEYNLSNVTVPVIIFSASDDWLSTPQDVSTLVQRLPNVLEHHEVQKEGFSHTDFVWGPDTPEIIFHKIFEALQQIPSKLDVS